MFIFQCYLQLLLAISFSLFSHVNAAGWTLDGSCDGDKATHVRNAMVQAFQMATDAAAELNKTPVNNDVLAVYRYIFADTDDVRNNKVRRVLERISGMSNEVPKNARDDSTVIVYCNFARFTSTESKSTLFDTDTYMNEYKKEIDDCKTSNPVKSVLGLTMAYTLSSVETRTVASQLQICPWYLDYSFNANLDDSKTYKMIRLTKTLYQSLWGNYREAEIDALSTFRVTMLHELAHTTEAERGVDGVKILDEPGYGWKKITKDVTNGHLNADSYAYFGLAINRMKDIGDPRLVQADGKLQEMASALAKRLLKAWEWFA